MKDVSPVSPEERAKHSDDAFSRSLHRLKLGPRAIEVTRRTIVGVYADGFIHAGNLAYLALLTLFPFFIVLAALANLFGHSEDTLSAVRSFLATVPHSVADLLNKPIADVLHARTGSLLWLGAVVGLWSVGSFIETIRDILRRAYGTKSSATFWHYRLSSILIIIISVILVLTSFGAQVVLTAAEQFVYRIFPFASNVTALLQLSRVVPFLGLAGGLYALIYSLTPSKYRFSKCPKWPGAVFTAAWWMLVTLAMPPILGLLGGYSMTYGGLAGTIIALLFFWFVGLGLVIGAHLNAALAETPQPGVKDAAQGD